MRIIFLFLVAVLFGPATVLGGVVKVAATLDDPGRIVRLTPWASLTIGAQPGPHVDLAATSRVLDIDGYDFAVASDIVACSRAKKAPAIPSVTVANSTPVAAVR